MVEMLINLQKPKNAGNPVFRAKKSHRSANKIVADPFLSCMQDHA